MDKFLALTEEKRLTILNAAFQCFGKFGYEKASINDIAVAAHISKASVFQYFGSKKPQFPNRFVRQNPGIQPHENGGAPKSAFYLAVYYQCLGGNFSRGGRYASDPDGGGQRIPKRSCSAGRGCFEIQKPGGCPAGLSNAASDGRGLCGPVPWGGGLRFSGCHGGF